MTAKLRDLRYELLKHPPCSPDLAQSDFYLFPNLKKCIAEKCLSCNDDVIAAVEGYFVDLSESYFKTDRIIREALDQMY